MRIGLLFGSFNPIHIGHLLIAESMLDNAQLAQIWFVVSPQNPMKRQETLAHDFDRLAMVRLAIADNPRLNASDVEFFMPKPSYTIDTLEQLSAKFPQHQFYVIMGEDNLLYLEKWKNYQKILDNYNILVYPRPFLPNPNAPLKTHPKVQMAHAPLIDISATYIRKKITDSHSVKYLLPDDVFAYIKQKKLYY